MLLGYIRNLPQDSATIAQIRGGQQFRGWDTSTYLLANLIDAVQINTYAFIRANAKRAPDKPQPVERPTVTKKTNKDPAQNVFMSMARVAFNAGQKGR